MTFTRTTTPAYRNQDEAVPRSRPPSWLDWISVLFRTPTPRYKTAPPRPESPPPVPSSPLPTNEGAAQGAE